MSRDPILSHIKSALVNFSPRDTGGGFVVSHTSGSSVALSFEIALEKIIWPTREGELIKDISKLPKDTPYRLTYPGTASTKSMVLYTSVDAGLLLISKPTLEFARLGIQRVSKNTCRISMESKEHHFVVVPFSGQWSELVGQACEVLNVPPRVKRKHNPPKLFLQIGVKDPFGNVAIKRFRELKKPIDYFADEVGPGHLIHFFGTNEAGFDRMFPDYTIAESLGGKKELERVVSHAQNRGLLTSHHFVPRIADSDWIAKHPEFEDAMIRRPDGKPVDELYKDHPYHVMNLNHPDWLKLCIDTVQYLASIGFDYLELDQFVYQRNFPSPTDEPLHVGYKKLVDECDRLGISYWLEGVSDAFDLPPGNFYQILVRDRSQLWGDHENRRGYPYGESHPQFFMSLRPDAEASYQVVTENTVTTTFPEKLETAREIHADLYDLQMDFYNEKYIPLLQTVLGHIKESMHDQIYSSSRNWRVNEEQANGNGSSKRGKKIGICHYRIGKTDGVSLEIEKRKQVLEDMGYEVKLIAGPESVGADYTIPELEFDRPEIVKIKENAFFSFKDYKSDKAFARDINKVAKTIEDQFLKIHAKEKFDYLFLHNIFSHGRHIAAAKSFANIAANTDIHTIAVNHDFYSVGSYVHVYRPTTDFVRHYLEEYVPPRLPKIKHVTINSVNRRALLDQKGIDSLVIPDTFDFDQESWVKDDYNKSYLKDIGVKANDLIVLQATRIVERKAIELAIDLVRELTERKQELVGKTLYNGKKITKNSDVVLVLAGFTEHASVAYRQKLEELIEESGIKAVFIHDHVDAWRGQKKNEKVYSLWDCYVYADLVTYPSVWEGWGNQFIEAVFARKPVVVFEYPVFKADIKPEGYDVISLGSTLAEDRPGGLAKVSPRVLRAAADKTIATLTDPATNDILEHNFKIGREHHDDRVLRQLLRKTLED